MDNWDVGVKGCTSLHSIDGQLDICRMVLLLVLLLLTQQKFVSIVNVTMSSTSCPLPFRVACVIVPSTLTLT